MLNPVQILGHTIGPGWPTFIIAEAGVNHNGKIDIAHRLIDAAVKAGAHAIKFQCFNTEELVTPQAPRAAYQIRATGGSFSQHEMLKALELAIEQHIELKAHCEAAGIIYLCTPYDITSVDALFKINVAAFKVSSTDTNNIPFLRYVARKNLPVLLSTGMSTLGEVEEAVNILRKDGAADKIVLLHCTSEYPAPVEEANLRAIATLKQAFCCPVGFSDHTVGIEMSAYAVATGAHVIEKHFTLDRTMEGPDHRASIEAQELAALVNTIRSVETALGDGRKRPMPSEIANGPKMRKSLVACIDIPKGAVIRPEDLSIKRPGSGLSPAWFDRVIGKRSARDIPANTLLELASVVWE